MKLSVLLLTATVQLAFVVSTPVSISTSSDERDMVAVRKNVGHEMMARAPAMELIAVDEFGKATPFVFTAACIACTTAAAKPLGYQGNPIVRGSFTGTLWGAFQVNRRVCAAVCNSYITARAFKDGKVQVFTQTEQAWISDIVTGQKP